MKGNFDLSPGDLFVNTQVDERFRLVLMFVCMKFDKALQDYVMIALRKPIQGEIFEEVAVNLDPWLTIKKLENEQ